MHGRSICGQSFNPPPLAQSPSHGFKSINLSSLAFIRSLIPSIHQSTHPSPARPCVPLGWPATHLLFAPHLDHSRRDAWNKLSGLSSTDAMKLYVEHFIELLKAAPGGESDKYVSEIDGEFCVWLLEGGKSAGGTAESALAWPSNRGWKGCRDLCLRPTGETAFGCLPQLDSSPSRFQRKVVLGVIVSKASQHMIRYRGIELLSERCAPCHSYVTYQ